MVATYIINYNMGSWNLSDIHAHVLGPLALGLGHIYQANPTCPCYNLHMQSHTITDWVATYIVDADILRTKNVAQRI